MPSLAAPQFDWEDTPNPRERAFSVMVKEGPETVLPALGTPWAACPASVKRAADMRGTDEHGTAYAAYTLALHEKAGFQTRRFLFVRPKTLEERLTPFKSWRVKRPHNWPTVLHKLWFEEGSLPNSALDASGAIQTSASVHERTKHRPGGVFPTVFIIQHFLSDVPFDTAVIRGAVPVTDAVQWSFDGNSGSFPACLHPRVVFNRYQSSGNVLYGMGTEAAGLGGDLVRQEFPATAMEDWETYPVSDTPQEVRGQWFRELVLAVPPIDDRENTA